MARDRGRHAPPAQGRLDRHRAPGLGVRADQGGHPRRSPPPDGTDHRGRRGFPARAEPDARCARRSGSSQPRVSSSSCPSAAASCLSSGSTTSSRSTRSAPRWSAWPPGSPPRRSTSEAGRARAARRGGGFAARARASARESLDANVEFHRIIVECVRNRRLKALVGQLQGQVHRARLLWPSTPGRLDETWKEHAELVAALRARDPDRAEQTMRTHLEHARASTLDRMLPVTR